MNFFDLSSETRGGIFIAAGAIMLLGAFGFFEAILLTLVKLAGVCLIIYGVFLGDFIIKIKKLLEKKPQI